MNEVLKSFLDNIFKQLPHTTEMEKLKTNLETNMHEKYVSYLKEGKTDNEAIGLVISEFGSIDEIIEEYGINLEQPRIKELEETEVFEIIRAYHKYSNLIGFGVLILITMFGILLGGYLMFKNEPNISLYLIAVLIVCLLPALALIISSSIILSPFTKTLSNEQQLTTLTKEKVKKLQKDFFAKYATAITIAVILCVTGMIAFIIGFSEEEMLYFLIPIGTFIISIGVYLFIKYGNLYNTYNRLLADRYKNKINQKAEKAIDTVAGIYWTIVVAIYLATGFIWELWHINWVIFPIMGVLFGGVTVIIEAKYNKREDE